MKKKVIAFAVMAILTISMATSAFAAPAFAAAPRTPVAPAPGYGLCGGAYGIMWDQDGNFLDSEAFEANLDKLIEDGLIRAEDRDYFVERYEWCAAYGGGAAGLRGGGRGMGRGMGCGMGRGW